MNIYLPACFSLPPLSLKYHCAIRAYFEAYSRFFYSRFYNSSLEMLHRQLLNGSLLPQRVAFQGTAGWFFIWDEIGWSVITEGIVTSSTIWWGPANRQNLAGQNLTGSWYDAADATEHFGWYLIHSLWIKYQPNPDYGNPPEALNSSYYRIKETKVDIFKFRLCEYFMEFLVKCSAVFLIHT